MVLKLVFIRMLLREIGFSFLSLLFLKVGFAIILETYAFMNKKQSLFWYYK
ncbi:hypothetical protein DSECCO2_224090 [anaerobic digester metagenome]